MVIRPTLGWLGEAYATPEREVMLLAIPIQESGLAARFQGNRGPARSYYQIEMRTAGIVMAKWPDVRRLDELGLTFADYPSWLPWSDVGACAIACGIMALEPSPLPAVGDEAGAWTYYTAKTWRPGKPRRDDWHAAYQAAVDVVGG
jgi:hypothetical protein